MGLFKPLFGKKKSAEKYSAEWFRSVSDEDLSAEREPIRLNAIHGDFFCTRLMDRFNDEEERRMNTR